MHIMVCMPTRTAIAVMLLCYRYLLQSQSTVRTRKKLSSPPQRAKGILWSTSTVYRWATRGKRQEKKRTPQRMLTNRDYGEQSKVDSQRSCTSRVAGSHATLHDCMVERQRLLPLLLLALATDIDKLFPRVFTVIPNSKTLPIPSVFCDPPTVGEELFSEKVCRSQVED